MRTRAKTRKGCVPGRIVPDTQPEERINVTMGDGTVHVIRHLRFRDAHGTLWLKPVKDEVKP
jgi:hypothetical protein